MKLIDYLVQEGFYKSHAESILDIVSGMVRLNEEVVDIYRELKEGESYTISIRKPNKPVSFMRAFVHKEAER